MTKESKRQQEIDEVFTTLRLDSPQARAEFGGLPEQPRFHFNVVISGSSNPF